MINLRKVRKMQVLVFRNALRLHQDSIYLFKNKSFPSANFLSILALEELGKFFILDRYIWNADMNGRDDYWERQGLERIYNHIGKQSQFMWDGEHHGTGRGLNSLKKITEGTLEMLKQNSVYVGLPRKHGKIDFDGKIQNPLKISKVKACRNIVGVSNTLILYICRSIIEGEEVVELRKIMKRALVRHLVKLWPPSSNRVIGRIKSAHIT